MIPGIDAAVPQGLGFDWDLVAANGERFAWCKATEGAGHVDKTFHRNRREANRVGLHVGPYHFFRAEADPLIQAAHFHRVVGALEDDELPPVIDFESLRGGTTPAEALVRAVRFVEATEEFFGRVCVVYTYPSFWTGALGNPESPELGTRPLWIAHYNVDPKTGAKYTLRAPYVPRPWKTWLAWQTSGNKGPRIPGIHVDVDRNTFNGTIDDLRTLCRRAPIPVPSKAPATDPQTPRSKSVPAMPAVRIGPTGEPIDPRTEEPYAIPNAADFVRALQSDDGEED